MIGALALLLAVGCASGGTGGTASASPSPPPATAAVNTCAKAHQSKHIAYLVVQHLSGQAIERCAGFDGDAIDAGMVMRATGIQYQTAGTMICQIDHEPLQMSGCSPEQAHWSLWLYTAGAWTAPTAGYDQLQLHDRDALGWRYVVSPVPPPSPPVAPRPL
ncbi:MAG TPA: hypothetical protein VGO86_13295 [Candidatus Dormibacteraeota bacterium]